MDTKEPQLLFIKLKHIKYAGDYIGRELKISIKIKDQLTIFGVRLRLGEEKELAQILYQKTIGKKNLILPVIFEVKEIREKHIDSGFYKTSIGIKFKKNVAPQYSFTVKVHGAGKEKGKIAVITFAVEAEIQSAIRYVSDVEPNGWLKVKFEEGKIYPLPYLLKVALFKVEKGREYFQVLEGKFRGRNASVGLKEDKSSYLLSNEKHSRSAKLILDQDRGTIQVLGLGIYKVLIDESNPLSSTLKYDLEIPDEPHPLGSAYTSFSKYAKTWFRIGHDGNRYLHVGSLSMGCVAVTDKCKWTEIYNFLIRSREDDVSVGVIEVL